MSSFELLLAASLAAVVTGCGLDDGGGALGATEGVLTDAHYAVMSAAIPVMLGSQPFAGTPRSAAEHRPIRQIVIIGEQNSEGSALLDPIETTSGPPMDPATSADHAKTGTAGLFERRFTGIGAYELLPIREMKAMFGAGGEAGWLAFYERYPDAPGFLALSRVGFNADRTEAVVRVLHLRSGTWGNEDALLFRLKSGRWVLAGRRQLSVI